MAKKSACVLMRSCCSTSCHRVCSCASSSLVGATYASTTLLDQSGCGSALRSTFSLGSSGMLLSDMSTEGTMCPGSRPFSSAMVAAESMEAGVTYATRRCEPVGSLSTSTTASWTPATSDSACSTSPNSTRKPRSLICHVEGKSGRCSFYTSCECWRVHAPHLVVEAAHEVNCAVWQPSSQIACTSAFNQRSG